MALFIAGLALTDAFLDAAKVGIIGGSVISAVVGMTLLIVLLPAPSAAARAEGGQDA
jgi:NhaA family Na+:H+ antiporter